MQDVYILGAGGFARELAEKIIPMVNRTKDAYHIIGYLDDNAHALDQIRSEYQIVGRIRDHQVNPDCGYILGIANPEVKKRLVYEFEQKNANFVSVYEQDKQLGSTARVGRGVVMYTLAYVGANCTVGDFVTLLNTKPGHDSVLEDFCTVSSNCGILGGVVVGEGAFVGEGAIILQNCVIGKGAKVGIGSVVINHVKPGTTVFGNPARRIW